MQSKTHKNVNIIHGSVMKFSIGGIRPARTRARDWRVFGRIWVILQCISWHGPCGARRAGYFRAGQPTDRRRPNLHAIGGDRVQETIG